MKEQVRRILIVLLAWFLIALAVGLSGVFLNASAPGVALTVWGLTALVLVACWKISVVRDGILALDPRALFALHLTRLVGLYFLFLASHHKLPVGFARPAGIGDTIVAVAALVLLLIGLPRLPKLVLIIWNAFGLLDIIFVVSSALRFGLRDLESMGALRALPLSLLPTFLVPLIIASHLLIFVRLKVDVTFQSRS